MERTCIICNATFNSKRSDAEVCSQRCRQKHWRNKKNEPSPEKQDLSEDLLKEQAKYSELEKQLKESLLLYNNQTATIVKLEEEKTRLARQVDFLSRELEECRKQPQNPSNSISGVVPIGAKVAAQKARISETTWSGDLQKVMKEIEASDLPMWAKIQLRSFSNEHRINFSN